MMSYRFVCLLITSVLVAVNPSVASAAPRVEVSTDSAAYYWGDTAEVILSVTNGDSECSVDFYLALIAPDGTPYFYSDWTHFMHPGISGILLPANFSTGPFVFLSCPIPGSDPPILTNGTFAFGTAFMGAGSDELLQDISFAFQLSKRNYVMSRGHVIAHGTAEELLEDETIRKTYLGL